MQSQKLTGIGRNRSDRETEFAVELIDEVIDYEVYVFTTLAKGRQYDRHDV